MKRILTIGITLLLLASCQSPSTPTTKSNKLKIVTTSYPVYEFVRELVNEDAQIDLLSNTSGDAHNHDQTPQDLVLMNEADVLVYTNDILEPWMNTIKQSLKSSVVVINASSTIKTIDQHNHDGQKVKDPHTWVSMKNAKQMVSYIYEALLQTNRLHAQNIKENYESYITKLKQLDQDYETVFKQAKTSSLIFLGHFAFNYLLEDYHFEYKVLYETLTHGSEPTANRIKEIMDYIEKQQIQYVFIEESSNDKVVDLILSKTQTTPLELHGSHQLNHKDQEEKTTFIQLQQRNIDNLKKGLQ